MEPVIVELLGVARHLAGAARCEVAAEGPLTLADVCRALWRRYPALDGVVLDGSGRLLGGHVLTRDGRIWLADPQTPLQPGERLTLLSTVAGG